MRPPRTSPPPAPPPPGLAQLFQLVMQYGWASVLAIFFLSLYFGWLPDPHRAEIKTLVAGATKQMAGVRAELRRSSERQLKMLTQLLELCLAVQRHDAKSIGSCSYIY